MARNNSIEFGCLRVGGFLREQKLAAEGTISPCQGEQAHCLLQHAGCITPQIFVSADQSRAPGFVGAKYPTTWINSVSECSWTSEGASHVKSNHIVKSCRAVAAFSVDLSLDLT